jgi:hypothetical protein
MRMGRTAGVCSSARKERLVPPNGSAVRFPNPAIVMDDRLRLLAPLYPCRTHTHGMRKGGRKRNAGAAGWGWWKLITTASYSLFDSSNLSRHISFRYALVIESAGRWCCIARLSECNNNNDNDKRGQ